MSQPFASTNFKSNRVHIPLDEYSAVLSLLTDTELWTEFTNTQMFITGSASASKKWQYAMLAAKEKYAIQIEHMVKRNMDVLIPWAV